MLYCLFPNPLAKDRKETWDSAKCSSVEREGNIDKEFSYLRHGRFPGKEVSRVRILDKLPAKLFFQSVSEGA